MPLLILIADDDPGVRLAISDYLELSGYSVISAENGQQALSLIESYQPHLLVSDIRMPGKNGYELVQQVRQRPEFRLLPVIFLTERNSTEERIRGYQVGCDVYLPKPFAMEELGAVIRNLLERSFIQIEKRIEHNNKEKPQGYKKELSQFLDPYQKLLLTEREKQVLDLVSTGLSNIEIGHQLNLSPRTIEKYVSKLFNKTRTNNRAELVRFAVENNLLN